MNAEKNEVLPSPLSMIAALDLNHAIGFQNAMPWHLPDDLVHFKRLTVGQTVLMGRKTFLSIGRALPKRRNIVLTRDSSFEAAGVEVVHSLEEALRLEPNPVVMGGGEIYEVCLPLAQTLHLTFVQTQVANADVFFPKYNLLEWKEVSRKHHKADERHAFAFDWVSLKRQAE